MQGQKDFSEKLYYGISLNAMVPVDDFYRKINRAIDFRFLQKATRHYYGTEGQKSIDPIVFFKICMVGYLNNLNSDRALLRFCANALNVRLFLGYDFDEDLPWHSTISRTRQLYGEDVFRSLFKEVLRLCVEILRQIRTLASPPNRANRAISTTTVNWLLIPLIM